MTNAAKANFSSAYEVKRRIPLRVVRAECLQQAIHALGEMESVLAVYSDAQGRLHIRYDASRIAFREIENTLDQAGISRPSGLWWHWKSGRYRYQDEIVKSNASSPGGFCCNRPPTVSGTGCGADSGQ